MKLNFTDDFRYQIKSCEFREWRFGTTYFYINLFSIGINHYRKSVTTGPDWVIKVNRLKNYVWYSKSKDYKILNLR